MEIKTSNKSSIFDSTATMLSRANSVSGVSSKVNVGSPGNTPGTVNTS